MEDYFKTALSNFTHEAASGGAIRHLADLGYTVNQIMGKLTFPTPLERVRKEVWERLVDTEVILLEEPGSGKQREKAVYVEEHDRYGRVSFRKVAAPEGGTKQVLWRERLFGESESGYQGGNKSQRDGGSQSKGKQLAAFMTENCAQNGEEQSYCSCNFGLLGREDPVGFQAAMDALDGRQRDYITGLPWEKRICYHRLDLRMREIVAKLYECGEYSGTLYFLKTEEMINIIR